MKVGYPTLIATANVDLRHMMASCGHAGGNSDDSHVRMGKPGKEKMKSITFFLPFAQPRGKGAGRQSGFKCKIHALARQLM